MFPFSNVTTPAMRSLELSDDEQRMFAELESRGCPDRGEMQLSEAFYLGQQIIDNLRIAVQKELEWLRIVPGWAAMAVDPYVERLQADCFRLTTATDGDQTLSDIMAANNFAAEQALAFTDALSMKRSFWMVGSPAVKGDAPVITVESPLNTSVLWDAQGRNPRAALLDYADDNAAPRKTIMLPRRTIHLSLNDKRQWVVADRDDHDFDFVPLVRMAHAPRTNNRNGSSAITHPMRTLIAEACRSLLSLSVAGQIYSVPGLIILGAAEDAFQNQDGTPKTAWQTYISSILALERDENGDLPTIHQKTPYDPSVYTKVLDWYASAMAGMVAATPQDLGLYTQGNPASAEAGVVAENRRDRRAIQMQNQFGGDLVSVAKMAMRFENRGVLPKGYESLMVDWDPVSMDTPAVTSDAITKQIAAGSISPTSDVTLKRLGYSAVERARLEQDRKREDGRRARNAIAASLMPVPQTPEAPSGNAGL